MKYIAAALIALILGFVTYLLGTFTVTIFGEFHNQPDNLGLFLGLVMMTCTTISVMLGTIALTWMELKGK